MRALRLLAAAAFAAADLCVLVALMPDWRDLGHGLAAPHRWVADVGTDQAAAALAGAAVWLVMSWLALGLLAACGGALPGVAGHTGRLLARRLLPGVLLRSVAGLAGLGMLLSPVSAAAKTAGGPAPTTGQATAVAGPVPSWPTDTAPLPHIQVGWPTTPAPRTAAHPSPAPPTAAHPSPAPPSAAHPRPASPTAAHPRPVSPTGHAVPDDQRSNATGGESVRVEPGDSLWLIAAKRLGTGASDADVAAAWPRWYAANAQVIGDDPSLIRPGQMLHAPGPGN